MADLKLYNYYRSSASYRVRIVLHWKGLPFEYLSVHLVKNGGEQHSEQFRALNPMGHVPALIHGDFVVAESMAIADYLDRTFKEKPVFPSESKMRAKVIQVCEVINSGIQPYQNVKILNDFEKSLGWNQEQRENWVRKWVMMGLSNLEKIVEKTAGQHAVGDAVTAADAFVIPQLFGSRRFKIDIDQYPTLARIEKAVTSLEPFKKAHPEAQIDFEK